METRALPMETRALPTEKWALPIETRALPKETRALPTEKWALPMETRALPIEKWALPMETRALPMETRALPMETRALPTEKWALPMETRALPMETRALPMETRALPMETRALPTDESLSRVGDGDRRLPEPGLPGRRTNEAIVAIDGYVVHAGRLTAAAGSAVPCASHIIVREVGTIQTERIPTIDGIVHDVSIQVHPALEAYRILACPVTRLRRTFVVRAGIFPVGVRGLRGAEARRERAREGESP